MLLTSFRLPLAIRLTPLKRGKHEEQNHGSDFVVLDGRARASLVEPGSETVGYDGTNDPSNLHYWSRPLFFHHVVGISDTFGPYDSQLVLLNALTNPDYPSCPRCDYLRPFLDDSRFFPNPDCCFY